MVYSTTLERWQVRKGLESSNLSASAVTKHERISAVFVRRRRASKQFCLRERFEKRRYIANSNERYRAGVEKFCERRRIKYS